MRVLIPLLAVWTFGAPSLAGAAGARVVVNEPGWPLTFELDVGQSIEVAPVGSAGPVKRTIRLVSVDHEWEPDYYVRSNKEHRTIRSATVKVEVGGRAATVLCQPYQSPVDVGGLRLYAEVTRLWAARADLGRVHGVAHDVRLSCVAAGEPWGPPMRFPIRNYRWRSSTYNNTWRSLVPYNRLYYHAGDDFGVVPDRLDVVAPFDGRVVGSPLPRGDGRSNGVSIRAAGGPLVARLAHMNIETIDPRLVVGAEVRAGQTLGKTGNTWAGRRAQYNDPHLHVGFAVPGAGAAGDKGGEEGTAVSTFPYLAEAYFRDYPDSVAAIAGGYVFTVPGEEIALDGGRSLARPGRRVASHRWELSDGRTIDAPTCRVRYGRPGLYSETLVVRGDDGSEDRDFLQVRVYVPDKPAQPLAFGWLHHAPVRGVRPGTEVTFLNRLIGAVGGVRIDFGDGTPPQAIRAEAKHAYAKPGLYTVALESKGPGDAPVTVKGKVVVEP